MNTDFSMPEGVEALYFQMPWGDVLCIHARNVAPGDSHPYSHSISEERVSGFLFAMSRYDTVEGKREMFYKMVGKVVAAA